MALSLGKDFARYYPLSYVLSESKAPWAKATSHGEPSFLVNMAHGGVVLSEYFDGNMPAPKVDLWQMCQARPNRSA